MADFKTSLMTAVVLLHMIQALAQNGSIVLDGVFDDWAAIEGLEDSVTEDTPAVDLLEMKVTSDAEHLYVYVRLASDLDLTDVLYPHNLFLQVDVDTLVEQYDAVIMRAKHCLLYTSPSPRDRG